MSKTMNTEQFKESKAPAVSWGEASDMLAMLAQIVNVVPDKTWVPSLAKTVGALDSEAPGCERMKAYLAKHTKDSIDDLVQDLAVDWTLAFRGMNPAHGPRPPYAGAWLADDGTGVELMLAINSLYVEEGLGVSGDHLNRLDYIGVELEFMAHLVKRFAEEGTDELAKRIVDFEDRFILSWFFRFQKQVEERCAIEFWKGYLELLAAALEDIREGLSAK
ncbi:MAG: molecular chaperone TorD family protein [Gordonibacter sp.]|uniref:TorD/DmsD family molecular chaperone n=1 Tax=Gordonibacter sp. TaxID=1968902 RepID=UPI00321FF16C